MILLWLCIILVSCHRASEVKNIFRYNEQSGIATLDPAFAKNQSIMWAIHQIYNTLVQTDDQLNIVPSLATSWDVSADNLVFTFHLRKDVYFHERTIYLRNGTV